MVSHELPYVDQLMISLSKWNKFRRGPRYKSSTGRPEALGNPTETPALSVARKLLKEKYGVRPTEFRLLSTMTYFERGADLDKIKSSLKEAGFSLSYDPYKFLIELLKPICNRKPKEERLAYLDWISKNEKYNRLTRRGFLFLKADFPPWDRAGPIHRQKASYGKFCCERMGGYAQVIWHGRREVDRHIVPDEREPGKDVHDMPEEMEPDMVIVFPKDPYNLSKPGRLDWEKWDWDPLHGEVMDPMKRPGRVKSALRKNVNLGRRTVFFVTGWKEALKVREKALEFLDENDDLQSKLTVGMGYIPDDCVVIIQPIRSPTPTKSERERLWERETVERIAEAVASGGSFRKSKATDDWVYVKIKRPGDKGFTGAGKVTPEGWEWVKEFRENTREAEWVLSEIRDDWSKRMRKAIKIEMEKDKRDRKIRIGKNHIEIGKSARKFEFQLNNETKKFLKKLTKT